MTECHEAFGEVAVDSMFDVHVSALAVNAGRPAQALGKLSVCIYIEEDGGAEDVEAEV